MGNLHGPVQWGSMRKLWWKGRVRLLPLLPTKGGSYDLHPDTPRLVMFVIFLDIPLGRPCRRLDHLRESELTDLGVEGTRDRFRSNAVELESRILSNRRSNVRSNRTRSNTRSNRTRSNTRSNRTPGRLFGRIRHGRMSLTMGLYRRRPVLTILQRGTNQESMGAPSRYSVCFMNSSPGISDAPCPRVTDVLVQCASPNKKGGGRHAVPLIPCRRE